jgi:hypothetical protein
MKNELPLEERNTLVRCGRNSYRKKIGGLRKACSSIVNEEEKITSVPTFFETY